MFQRWMEESKNIFEGIENHKFIQELIDGSLDEKIFKDYISQYIIYCDIFNAIMKNNREKAW